MKFYDLTLLTIVLLSSDISKLSVNQQQQIETNNNIIIIRIIIETVERPEGKDTVRKLYYIIKVISKSTIINGTYKIKI